MQPPADLAEQRAFVATMRRVPPLGTLSKLSGYAIGHHDLLRWGCNEQRPPRGAGWKRIAENLSRTTYGGYRKQLEAGLDTEQDAEALALWRRSQPLDATMLGHPVAASGYLASLNLPTDSPSLRSGTVQLFPTDSSISLPVLVAAVARPDRVIIGVGITLLTWRGGVGDAPKLSPRSWRNKWTVGDLGKGAVHLSRAADAMALAISIESALAVQRATSLPVWAVIEAERIATTWLPPDVRCVALHVEADTAADVIAEAERAHQERGRRVDVRQPPAGCATWLEAHAREATHDLRR